MATTIKLKSGSGAPLAGDLVAAEPAFDLTNKRLYTKDSVGTVIEVGTNPTSLTTGTFTSTGIDDNATSTAITIDSSQNVGIGTTGASIIGAGYTQLQVNGSTSGIIDLLASDTLKIRISADGNLPTISARVQGEPLRFSTTPSGGSASERMRIDSSGNVGIGTSSPQYKGQITNTSDNNVTDVLALHNGSNALGTGTGARLLFKLANFETAVESRKYASIEGLSTAGYNESIALVFKTQASASSGDPAERMRIDSSGNLLVGKTSASGSSTGCEFRPAGNLLAVNDSSWCAYFNRKGSDGDVVLINNDNTQVGSISISGSTTSYNTSSDERLKENIVDAPAGNIDAIRVRSFDWKADGTHQTYGMVAQELVDVAPEAVTQGETEDDMWGVDYSKLVPMMIKEIQDLKAEVAALKGA